MFLENKHVCVSCPQDTPVFSKPTRLCVLKKSSLRLPASSTSTLWFLSQHKHSVVEVVVKFNGVVNVVPEIKDLH